MTPVAWLINNSVFLLIFAAIIGALLHKLGLEGLWNTAIVIIGLGVLIFVHELGHFLAAKWCDVHVQTFSIGFGPALPGCSFQRGETTYKIGAIPLGGYVNMVGEGTEADEDENYPRSFKNKSVGQRMLIISAGVIMNVILGAILFVCVYMYHGDYRPPATVGAVEPASPIWQKGIPTGSVITRIDGVNHPYFDDLRLKVALSAAGEQVPFVFAAPDGSWKRPVDLLPRKEENDPNPIIGLAPPDQLKLFAAPKKPSAPPVVAGSAAASARPLGLKPGDVVVATTDPKNPDSGLLPLSPDRGRRSVDYQELARRVRALAGKKLVLSVLPAGTAEGASPEQRDIPPEGFAFEDIIVGTTDPESTNPFVVIALPEDPRNPGTDHPDPFEFHRRLVKLKGKPMVIQVQRANTPAGTPPVDLFVPPAYHYIFGLQMQMGEVAGVRDGSPAAIVGVQKGDKLVAVQMADEKGNTLLALESNQFDGMRLPSQLYAAAVGKPGKKTVTLTVESADGKARKLPPAEWQQEWDFDEEVPLSLTAPIAIPQLGLAYRVTNQVFEVRSTPAGEGAAPARPLAKGDQVRSVWFQNYSRNGDDKPDWEKPERDMQSQRNGEEVYESWPWLMNLVGGLDFKTLKFKVHHPGGKNEETVELTAEEDLSWPATDRGFRGRLQGEYHIEKAANLGQALVMGANKTGRMIKALYLQLRGLATGRISAKQLGGPVAMISQGYMFASMGWWELMLFLGAMSINLAVVNFLPIPILDGGHMVFLIYEKLRGRPPSEAVRWAATCVGLALILGLFVFVFVNDYLKVIRPHLGW
jgi:regulator of sigma E protease